MKKYLLFSLAAICIRFASSAQSTVTFGTPYAKVDATYKTYFQKGNDLLTVKAEHHQVVLQKLNTANLSLVSSKTFVDFPKGYHIEKAVAINGAFYLFYSLPNKKDKTVQLFSREINFEQGSFSSPATVLLSASSKTASFDFHVSQTQSKLLIHAMSSSGKEEKILALYVFNQGLQASWQTVLTLSGPNVVVLDDAVDNEGNVYLLKEISSDKKENGHSMIELVTVKAIDATTNTTALSLNKHSIRKVGLFETADQYILCAGFYTKDINTSSAGGLFVLKADPSGKLYDELTFDISQTVINQYTNSTDRHEESYLTLRDVLLEKDGGLTLIGESAHLETERYYTPKGLARNAYYLHYDDILISKLDASGHLSWMKKLPKHQMGKSSEGQGQMSYRYLASDQSYYLIFLDNASNVHLSMDDTPANYLNGQPGSLTAYEVNKEKGTLQKINLLDVTNSNKIEVFDFATNKIIPLEATSFVIELSGKGKSDVLVKATLAQ